MMTEEELNTWAYLVGKRLDRSIEIRDTYDLIQEPKRYGYFDGYADGLASALTCLNIIEQGKMSDALFNTLCHRL